MKDASIAASPSSPRPIAFFAFSWKVFCLFKEEVGGNKYRWRQRLPYNQAAEKALISFSQLTA